MRANSVTNHALASPPSLCLSPSPTFFYKLAFVLDIVTWVSRKESMWLQILLVLEGKRHSYIRTKFSSRRFCCSCSLISLLRIFLYLLLCRSLMFSVFQFLFKIICFQWHAELKVKTINWVVQICKLIIAVYPFTKIYFAF